MPSSVIILGKASVNLYNKDKTMRSVILITILFLSAFAPIKAALLPPGFIETPIAMGLDPTAMTQTPDGRILIAEKYGAVRVVENGELLQDPMILLDVDNYNERGLSGIAVHPDFETNGYLYLYYTVPNAGFNRLIRVKASGNYADPSTTETLFEGPLLAGTSHNGGAMVFGQDGKLYLSIGDGLLVADAASNESVLGKILRLNDDGTIPTDNPFYQQNSGIYRAIYASGFRNPFSLAIQPGTGRIYSCDVGSEFYEEVNHIQAGKFYGWNFLEGYQTGQNLPANYQDPVYAYSHSIGCAVVGASFYNPPSPTFPSEYHGRFFFADYCKNYIKYLDPETGGVEGTFATEIDRPIVIMTGNDGSLYYISRGGVGGGSEDDNTSSLEGILWKVEYVGDGAPVFSKHPKDLLVVVGENATFSAQANGSATIEYSWTIDGSPVPDVNEPSLLIENLMLSDSGKVIQCLATNGFGQIESLEAVLSVTSNQRPEPEITRPLADLKYAAGEPFQFEGRAEDPESGLLSPDALSWRIDIHHDDHTHPGMAAISGAAEGEFTLPVIGETAENIWLRVYLSATDPASLTKTVYRDIYPDLVTLSFESNPEDIAIRLDGKTNFAPFNSSSVRGIRRLIEAPRMVDIDNTPYVFDSWNTGETNPVLERYPQQDSNYIANYRVLEPGEGTGLIGTYYHSDPVGNFITPAFSRLDSIIDFDWGDGSPSPELANNEFAIRWNGYIEPMFTEEYTFSTKTDDGSRLWVNYELILDFWKDKGAYEVYSDPIFLEAGKKYPITLEYYENAGLASAELNWSAPGIISNLVPKSRLYPALPIYQDGLPSMADFTIQPNPVTTNRLIVRYDMSHQELINYRIFSTDGQLILEQDNVEIFITGQQIEIELPGDLDSGIYIFQSEGTYFSGIQTAKFFKS